MSKQEIETKIKSLIGEKEFQSYKNFAFREDMFKLAVGIILGNSLNKVVYGFSDYLLMPIFKFALSKTGEDWKKWRFSPIEGLNFEIGNLLSTVVDFILISIVLYIFYIKLVLPILRRRNKEEPKEIKKEFEKINVVKKCSFCIGDLDAKPRRIRRKNKRTKNDRGK